MSKHTASGRRRAGAPAAQTRPRDAHRLERRARAEPAPPPAPSHPDVRPRDLQRRDRRRRAASARKDISFTGLSQKVAIAAAASGLVLTVTVPTTAAVVSPNVQAAGVEKPAELRAIQAAEEAAITFDRAALHGKFDPEAKLQEIVTASGGEVRAGAAEGSLSAPMDKLVETSPFGYRVSPITGWTGELHSGQDFGSSCGADVLAAAKGTVVFAEWHQYGGGNRVVIDHGNGLETTYNHLSSISVQRGDVVGRGGLIAQSGTTGASTGCHLHFEVLVDGQAVDPLGWL